MYYIVSKVNVSAACSFCNNAPEHIIIVHLFWECAIVLVGGYSVFKWGVGAQPTNKKESTFWGYNPQWENYNKPVYPSWERFYLEK